MKTGKLLILIFLFFNTVEAFSQSIQRSVIFSSAGNYADAGTLHLQSNIGELMADTYAHPQGMLSQGFVQPETMMITLVNDHAGKIEAKAFPNPVTDKLYIELGATDVSSLVIEVFDLLGKKQSLPLSKANAGGHYELSFEDMQAGIYFVRISSGSGHYTKTFKINKV